MSTRNYFTAALLVGLFTSVPAAAQEGPLYFGLKAGVMDADASGFDGASNFGLMVGYELHRDVNGAFAIEGEYTRKLAEGDVDVSGVNGDWSIETLAAYGAYRTAGNAYLKAKAGVLREDIAVSGIGSSISGKDTSLSVGAGAGLRFTPDAALELELTVIEEDVNFLSLGYVTHF